MVLLYPVVTTQAWLTAALTTVEQPWHVRDGAQDQGKNLLDTYKAFAWVYWAAAVLLSSAEFFRRPDRRKKSKEGVT
jgi:hypothetical protein